MVVDRILGKVSIDSTKPGQDPVFSLGEESRFVSHLKHLAAVSFGYSRVLIISLASEFGVHLGKCDRLLTVQRFYNAIDKQR